MMKLKLIILVCSVLVILSSGCQTSPQVTGSTASTESAASTVVAVPAATTVAVPAATTAPTAAETAAPSETAAPTETTAQPLPVNPLTGEPLANPQAAGQRPVAIMINNIKVATPQIGISQADLIYEMPVESSITRLMAVFADVSAVPEIGSIRSARHDYIDLAGGLDAIYIHFGGSYLALAQLEKQNTDHVSLMNYPSSYWRDQAWVTQRGLEHSAKTTGDRLQKVIAQCKYRTSIRKDQKTAFQFRAAGDFAAADGQAANQVIAPYSTYAIATFEYDAATHLYSKGQYGVAQLDLATGQPIKFTNLLLLQTKVIVCDPAGLKDADLAKGKGYYVSGGQYQVISWTKGETNDSFVFMDTNGNELQVNTGKSYIGIIPDTSKITFKA